MNKRMSILLMLLAPLTAYGQTNMTIEQKMKEIIIPSVEFRQANPVDVLDFFILSCTASNPDIQCLSLMATNVTNREFYTYEVEDGSPLEFHPLTFKYERISMSEAIDRITKEIGITYRLENGAPVFFTQDGKRIIRKKHVEQSLAPYGAQRGEDKPMGNPYGNSPHETLCAPSGEP